MSENTLRLGDLVDDFCPRCKLLLNHAIASMIDGQVMKVICKTCYTEHAYRHGEGGKKTSIPRATLFDQVLAKSAPATAPDVTPANPPADKKKTAEPARYISRHKTKPPTKRAR